MRRRMAANPAGLTSTLNAFWFDVDVQIGNQTFTLLVDTGSSDTWVVEPNYLCIDAKTNTALPQGDCIWDPPYVKTDTFRPVSNQTFGVQYGTGIALGTVGHETVSLGGISVANQTIGVVSRTTDKGDGLSSGILGLGFPGLTSAHHGAEMKNDSVSLLTNRAIYNPLFVNMYKQGSVESWYSLALERPPNKTVSTAPGGWLGLGQLPPVSHSDKWAAAPIEVTRAIPDFYYQGKPDITLMTLTVDGVAWGTASNSTKFQAVVDSGNNMNMLPREIAEPVNAAFKPAAKFSADLGIYLVDCAAEAPPFNITIGGTSFPVAAADMISRDISSGACYSTVSRPAEGSGVDLNFVGDAFLRNVVAVFDFGKTEMRFAARTQTNNGDAKPTPGSSGASLHGVGLGLVLSVAAAVCLL
jgi:hypothetical protein